MWSRVLAEFKGRPELTYLEVGVFEGKSVVWMLENILTDPSSKVTAVDIFPDELLATFNKPNPSPSDAFGTSVAALGTDKLVVGAFRSGVGSVHIFSPQLELPALVSGGVVEGAITSSQIADGTIASDRTQRPGHVEREAAS